MSTRLTAAGVFLMGIALLVPVTLAAQEQGSAGGAQQQARPPARPDSVQLRAEREIFAYPGFERRNPFKPLLDDQNQGPRFELMRLQAIVYSTEPGRSLATITAGGGNQMTDTGVRQVRGDSRRLRVGESWGNVRVLEIRPDRIIVEVEEFGLSERREMRLQNRSLGGSR